MKSAYYISSWFARAIIASAISRTFREQNAPALAGSEAGCGGKLAVGSFEHLVGQRRAFDGARQGQGADQGRHGGDGLAAPRRLGFVGGRLARGRLAGDGLRQNVDQRRQT